MRRVVVAAQMLVMLAGCSSIRTTPLDRTEEDYLFVNPDKPLCGLPVMLRVPTHLEVSILETRYWKLTKDAKLEKLTQSRPILDIRHELKYTEKMFVVDPLRPLSGDQEYGFTFTSSAASDGDAIKGNAGRGYLSGLNYKAKDTTIVDSAALLGAALKRAGAVQANTEGGGTPANAIATTRVVAFRRFDVNSPTFEQDVGAFLDWNLNAHERHPMVEVTPNQ